MSVFNRILDKYRQGGAFWLAESIWRNFLRRTFIGSTISKLTSDVFVEKLVMTPRVGYWPRIRNPRSFNEKIAHRKHFTKNPLFSKVADKVSARSYVRGKYGDEILNEVYHITRDPNDIPFDKLPNEFVIKTGNKGAIIVEDKNRMDLNRIKKECRSSLNEPYGVDKGEYWYAEIDPSLVIERKLSGYDSDIPTDYKFFVFDGKVEYIQVNVDRFENHKQSIYDKDWNYIDVWYNQPKGSRIEEPKLFDEMVEVAERLGEDFNFMRVDLYQTADNGVIFGEMTPAPTGGVGGFRPKKYDFEFGLKWNL